MGRDDPYRKAPTLIGDEPIELLNKEWRVYAACRRCGHTGSFRNIASYAAEMQIHTASEFTSRVICSQCGGRDVLFAVEFVGRRRD